MSAQTMAELWEAADALRATSSSNPNLARFADALVAHVEDESDYDRAEYDAWKAENTPAARKRRAAEEAAAGGKADDPDGGGADPDGEQRAPA